MTLESGAVLGRYRVESLIGRGGMGAVYLATDTELDRRVALKVLAPELSDDEKFRHRFIAESRIAASLDHANIVPVYEAGEVDGRLFIAMRYIEGRDLSDVLGERGALPISLAVQIIAAIAAALDAAHAKGLVHRDVKPGNVLLAGPDEAPLVYLTDFGLTKRIGDQSMTAAGQIVGSIAYVAPEQVEGRPVDARTDVYSLGCLAFEILTGASPFVRDSEMAVLMAHVQDPPPSLLARRPELSEALDAAVARAMAKDPAARFGSAGDFARAALEAVRPDAGSITRGFLFADLRGYTAYVESHGDSAASALLLVYRRMMRDTIAKHGGAEIKTEGDSFYVVFPSASGAVMCGLSIVAAAAAQSHADPQNPIRVGIGVNAGEAVAAPEGYVGSAVNIAARVCALAKPGEVWVTDTVRGLTRTSGRLIFTSVGRHSLKGIAEPMALYHAEPAEGATAATAPDDHGPVWRRPVPVVVAGGLVIGLLSVAALTGGFGLARPGASASPSARAAEPIELVAYTEVTSTTTDAASCEGIGDRHIFLIDPSGGDPIPTIADSGISALRPSWSPDGTQLAFVTESSPDSLDVLDINSRAVTHLLPATPPAGIKSDAAIDGLSWASDGTELIFTWAGEVWAVATDGTHLRRLPVMTPTGLAAAGAPAWLADGSVAAILDDGSGAHLHDRLAIAPTEEGMLAPVSWLPENFAVAAVAWSIDRSQVAVVGSDRGTVIPRDATAIPVTAGGVQIHDLYLAGPDGSNLRTSAAHVTLGVPAWSPDGSQLVLASRSLFVMDVAKDKVRRVATPSDRAACDPSWGLTTDAALSTPSAAAEPGAATFRLGPLAPGFYAAAVLRPRVQFEVGAGWVGEAEKVDYLAVKLSGAASDSAGQFKVLTGEPLVFDNPCPNSEPRIFEGNHQDLITYLQNNPSLAWDNLKAVNVDEFNALQVDISVDALPSGSDCGDPSAVIESIPIFRTAKGDVVVGQLDAVRVISLDVNDVTVTFIIQTSRRGQEAFQAETQQMLDSLTFP
jgi:class 3 adenylate cyclase